VKFCSYLSEFFFGVYCFWEDYFGVGFCVGYCVLYCLVEWFGGCCVGVGYDYGLWVGLCVVCGLDFVDYFV